MDFLWSKSTQPRENTDPDEDFTRIDDDMFYAELKRQVLLLIDEDSEDSSETRHSKFTDDSRKSDSSRSFPAVSQPRGRYLSLWDMEIKNSAPNWLVKTWRRTGNGTGVFIPQIVKTTSSSGSRSSRRRGKCSEDGISQKLKQPTCFAGRISYGRRQVQTHGGLFMVEI